MILWCQWLILVYYEQWKFASDSLVFIFTVCEKCEKYTLFSICFTFFGTIHLLLNVKKFSVCLDMEMYIPYTLGKREWQSSSEKSWSKRVVIKLYPCRTLLWISNLSCCLSLYASVAFLSSWKSWIRVKRPWSRVCD